MADLRLTLEEVVRISVPESHPARREYEQLKRDADIASAVRMYVPAIGVLLDAVQRLLAADNRPELAAAFLAVRKLLEDDENALWSLPKRGEEALNATTETLGD